MATPARRCLLALLVGAVGVLAVATTPSATAATRAATPSAAVPLAPGGAADEVGWSAKQVNLNFNVDVNALGKSVAGLFRGARDRGAAVQSARDTVAYYRQKNGRRIIDDYNVMVFNRQVKYSARLKGIAYYKSFKYSGITYGIWVFRSGTWINRGDGGFINWAFIGKFKRSGKTVTFSRK
eukprot:TRINITY_DN2399_c0_g1_i1.p1 TRINITY_DN2399_c0_g1~~TRINITY_DN2399_c0_g1_i1.p1  ORF type:complete len:181 (-),score=72.57 TRINITY_DN2399_c0_g1_i1:328-870(-)